MITNFGVVISAEHTDLFSEIENELKFSNISAYAIDLENKDRLYFMAESETLKLSSDENGLCLMIKDCNYTIEPVNDIIANLPESTLVIRIK